MTTKPEPSQFPAHEQLKKLAEITGIGGLAFECGSAVGNLGLELLSEFQALQAQLAAYEEAVIVLPDDALPIKDDLVYSDYFKFPFKLIGKTSKWAKLGCSLGSTLIAPGNKEDLHRQIGKIIQRNGKPTIYANALLKAGIV